MSINPKKRKNNIAAKMTRIALFAAILAVLSQISIPLPAGVPMSAQTFAICLAAFVLGCPEGVYSVLVYILLGVFGAPVFSNFSGGIGHIISPTGGFIIGFLPLAALCGAVNTKKAASVVLLSFTGLVLCHVIGVVWFSYNTDIGIFKAFISASVPFILKDILSCVAAFGVSNAVKKRQ